jgi:uncharacterized membrane protein YgcG
MKGIIQKASVASALVASALASGCHQSKYHDLVDPSWPQRYNAVSRQEVVSAMGTQIQNGHILNQTVWNYAFDAGKETLTPLGTELLDQFVRTRPQPDARIFLATARDIQYDGVSAEKYAEARRELDSKRAEAIQRYLAAQTAGRPMSFEVLIHDPAPLGIAGAEATNIITQNRGGSQGRLVPGGPGGGAGGGGGGGGGGGASR